MSKVPGVRPHGVHADIDAALTHAEQLTEQHGRQFEIRKPRADSATFTVVDLEEEEAARAELDKALKILEVHRRRFPHPAPPQGPNGIGARSRLREGATESADGEPGPAPDRGSERSSGPLPPPLGAVLDGARLNESGALTIDPEAYDGFGNKAA